jgi:hypothetical protein
MTQIEERIQNMKNLIDSMKTDPQEITQVVFDMEKKLVETMIQVGTLKVQQKSVENLESPLAELMEKMQELGLTGNLCEDGCACGGPCDGSCDLCYTSDLDEEGSN